MRRLLILAADFVIAALILGGIWGANYVIPQRGIQAENVYAPAG